MRTDLPADLLATADGARANEILRACVHCGFCNATCPTYQETGDELDGPRGRIYLIKAVLEEEAAASAGAERAQRHLDRCLTCRACETTCPSGVAYGDLLEIGREVAEERVTRGAWERLQRWWLRTQLNRAARVRFWARLGGLFRPLLPRALARQVPRLQRLRTVAARPSIAGGLLAGKAVLLLDGCVQQAATPNTNAALERLLVRRGARVLRLAAGHCCGGLALHLSDAEGARAEARRLLDLVDALPVMPDAIVSSASGCGVTQRDYARWFAGDARYGPLAERWQACFCDAGELLRELPDLEAALPQRRVAWHAPCTLQHGQGLTGLVEPLLTRAGYELLPVADSGRCCGSAGTYSMLQGELSAALQAGKQRALLAPQPELIATANVGCQLHIADGLDVPVHHWLELLE